MARHITPRLMKDLEIKIRQYRNNASVDEHNYAKRIKTTNIANKIE